MSIFIFFLLLHRQLLLVPGFHFIIFMSSPWLQIRLFHLRCSPGSLLHFWMLLEYNFFFLSGFFFHNHSQITGLQMKGDGISLTPHYDFNPLRRHLDFSRTITTVSSPLHIGSSWTQTGNLWFASASR